MEEEERKDSISQLLTNNVSASFRVVHLRGRGNLSPLGAQIRPSPAQPPNEPRPSPNPKVGKRRKQRKAMMLVIVT